MSDDPTSFFLSNGDDYVGTALSRGPWDEGAAHGGPVAALIGREVERFDPDPELATVRFTIELLRPVPLASLRIESTLLRPGKRVRLIGVSITDGGGTEVARAVVLRVRRTPDDAPVSVPDADVPARSPEESGTGPSLIEGRVGITHAVELRSVYGSAIEPGPAAYWFRVKAPLVDDEPITPLTRLLIAADFGNGIGSVVSVNSHLFINPDLTVHVFRQPVGEWLFNEARTWLEPGGAGVAEATLGDRTGPVAKAMQSLYIASR
jgi:hypothetical protein